MQSSLEETELIRKIASGDRRAFTKIFETYIFNLESYIFNICNSREVSEEIVQELFIRIWNSRHLLAEVKALKPYLYRSAKNLLLNYFRKDSSGIHTSIETQEEYLITSQNPESAIIFREYLETVYRAIDQLPLKRQEIFKMRLLDGFSLDEIAVKLHISKSVVKKQLYKGVSFVRSYLYKNAGFILIYFWLISFC